MVFWTIVVVAAVLFVVWFVRTPLFRGHLRRGATPDQEHLRTGGIQYNDWKDLPPRD